MSWYYFIWTIQTALHLAVEKGHIEIVKLLLLEYGADVNASEVYLSFFTIFLKGYGISNKIKVHKFKQSVQVKLSEVLFFWNTKQSQTTFTQIKMKNPMFL
jgi:ankyrin repeat protein